MGPNQHSSPQYSQDSPYQANTFLDPASASSPGNSPYDNQFFNGASPPGNTAQDQYINPSNLLDPQILDTSEASVDPSNLMNPMAAAQHTPTPPHMLQPGVRGSASPHHSPSMSQSSFHSGAHSRHTSLDPSSAAFPTGEWANMGNPAFQGHRRAPSDAYSDVSSNHPSPYLGHTDQYESDQPSPLLSAQNDPALFQDVMTFQQFTISGDQNAQGTTPGHSPHISPRLPPQQQELPPFTAADNFGLQQAMNNQYGGMSFPEQPTHSGHGHSASVDFGQADQMSPPEINIDFAPPSRQPSFGPNRRNGGASENALSPPGRSKFLL
jgi:transcription factor CRZ1